MNLEGLPTLVVKVLLEEEHIGRVYPLKAAQTTTTTANLRAGRLASPTPEPQSLPQVRKLVMLCLLFSVLSLI
jgi:hypothetical protein